MDIFGVRILGLSEQGLTKLALSLAVIAVALLVRRLFRVVARMGLGSASRRSIWARKSVRIVIAMIAGLLLLSIWFDDPERLATFTGLVAAGLAFASQNLVLSIAAYFVIVIDAAREHTREHVTAARAQLEALRRLYLIEPGDLEPRAFLRLTDNWLELSVRFVVSTHGVRVIKDRISRDVLAGFTRAGVEIASQTIEITRLPPRGEDEGA